MISASDYHFIRELVYRHSRIALGPDKKELVSARLGKRMRARQLPSIGTYCQFLKTAEGAEEIGNLIDAISTNHTFFFREEAHFKALREQILPELEERRVQMRWPALRVWSAACSSGEEPYSIAITLDQHFGAAPSWPWSIQATDISHRVLEQARQGIYPAQAVARMPVNTAKLYFSSGYGPQEGNHRVRPALASRVRFSRLNLLDGPLPFNEPFQVIFCRNVMIYFDRATQEELIARLSRMLVPGGWLLVGHSESLSTIRHTLKMVRPAIYRTPNPFSR
ncbi:protein-glutamate O-methyltransferase [Termitidicoccus mucosus]|uniref:CheR family methyltransferase n=1 Tax=Termitidicoccus mucosus TaxID=1184151 RepID=UPI000ADBF70C